MDTSALASAGLTSGYHPVLVRELPMAEPEPQGAVLQGSIKGSQSRRNGWRACDLDNLIGWKLPEKPGRSRNGTWALETELTRFHPKGTVEVTK